jgi:transcriptional regulator with XRE-family HTH domain
MNLAIVAQRLKQARTNADISQKQLGILAGMEETAASARMNRYERSEREPDIQTLTAIAAVLNLPPSFFYAIDDDEAELLTAFHRLKKTHRAQVVKTAKSLSHEHPRHPQRARQSA